MHIKGSMHCIVSIVASLPIHLLCLGICETGQTAEMPVNLLQTLVSRLYTLRYLKWETTNKKTRFEDIMELALQVSETLQGLSISGCQFRQLPWMLRKQCYFQRLEILHIHGAHNWFLQRETLLELWKHFAGLQVAAVDLFNFVCLVPADHPNIRVICCPYDKAVHVEQCLQHLPVQVFLMEYFEDAWTQKIKKAAYLLKQINDA